MVMPENIGAHGKMSVIGIMTDMRKAENMIALNIADERERAKAADTANTAISSTAWSSFNLNPLYFKNFTFIYLAPRRIQFRRGYSFRMNNCELRVQSTICPLP
jgi:hypothetical protein